MIPDSVIYAQVEQFRSIQDYEPRRACMRLVGVDSNAFAAEDFNSEYGCRTFLVDISWDYFVAFSVKQGIHPVWFGMQAWGLDVWPGDLWVEIRYGKTPLRSGAYAYELFADAEPEYLQLESITLTTGPVISPTPKTGIEPTVSSAQSFKLFAYHVGQGMCAMLKGTSEGFLFDAGAGTPVTRAAYRSGSKSPGVPFINDLRMGYAYLALQAIISHPDSDHWRLLDWDAALNAAVTAVFEPVGVATLALRSPYIKPKVHAIGDTTVLNGICGAVLFETYRSQPSASDANGECLVVEARVNASTCLFPGDYVYDRMATDLNPRINSLATQSFDAVMVPHHGDAASASVLVSPRWSNASTAFFSAGTHAGYGHPTPSSLQAHASKNFSNIDRHTCDDIREHLLA